MRTRLLFLSHDSSLYGAQLSLLGLITALDRTRFAPHVIAPSTGALTERLEALRTPVAVTPLGYWIPLRNNVGRGHMRSLLRTAPARVSSICRLIRRWDIHLVYTNTITCIDGALASRLTRTPHIWHLREHVRGNSQLKPSLPSWIAPWIVVALSGRVIVNSQALRDRMFHHAFGGRIRVVHNGVDVNSFALNEDDGRLRRELGLSTSTKIVTVIGAVIRRKAIDVFVRAAAHVRREVADVAFLVVGKGDRQYENEIRGLIDALDLHSRFRLLGWRPDVGDVLQATDVLVSASEQEAFGRTIIEAMAASRPVVATRSGGPEEIVVHGHTGLLVPVGDPNEMGLAIVQLLQNPSRARAFGVAGRQRAEQLFTLDAHARKIEAIIQELIPHP